MAHCVPLEIVELISRLRRVQKLRSRTFCCPLPTTPSSIVPGLIARQFRIENAVFDAGASRDEYLEGLSSS